MQGQQVLVGAQAHCGAVSQAPGARVKDVAYALDIPSLMLRVRSLPCTTESDSFAFIARERERFEVTWMCRKLEVSRSGFYAWPKR